MESYSVPELVDAFISKWKIDKVDSIEKAVHLPVLVQNSTGYTLYFKGAVNRYAYDKVNKSMLINPDKFLSKYRLNQLVAASKGEYCEV